jgi:hypothetical protein
VIISKKIQLLFFELFSVGPAMNLRVLEKYIKSWISRCNLIECLLGVHNEGHFTHKPRAMTTQLWEPKGVQRPFQDRLQNHVLWSRILKCIVKSYVTRPSTKYYFKEFLYMRVLMVVSVWSAMVSRFCVRPTFKRWFWKTIQVTVKHDPFDAM